MVKILFFADSHLGIDTPRMQRIKRRRRGMDFYTNFMKILTYASREKADIVIHGGDVFFRSRIRQEIAEMVYRPLKKFAGSGIPVCMVPGNHERSALPFEQRLSDHPNIFIFKKPGTFLFEIRGTRVAVSGFPYIRNSIRWEFKNALDATGWEKTEHADIHLLCMHQIVEGARVGPRGFMFTTQSEVVRADEIPAGIDAILCGHIHRFQVLTHDLNNRRLRAPIFFAGSIERTSFDERFERKGFLMIEIKQGEAARTGETSIRWSFRELPTRVMNEIELDVSGFGKDRIRHEMNKIISEQTHDSIVRVRIQGDLTPGILPFLESSYLRSIVPNSINFEITVNRDTRQRFKDRLQLKIDEI